MSANPRRYNVAFIGATGGAVFNCLVHALKDENIDCFVLVRDSKKLSRLLAEAIGPLPLPYALEMRLRVLEGDVTKRRFVERTIFPPSIFWDPVDVIIFGLGGVNVHDRMIHDSEISKNGINAVFQAIYYAHSEYLWNRAGVIPSRIVAIGSLGIGAQVTRSLTQPPSAEAVAAKASYDWFKGSPAYDDKSKMEKAVLDEIHEAEFHSLNNLVVQPGLLTDDRPLGLAAIRHGSPESPPPGYSISREDLGEWLYEHGIYGDVKGTVVVCGP